MTSTTTQTIERRPHGASSTGRNHHHIHRLEPKELADQYLTSGGSTDAAAGVGGEQTQGAHPMGDLIPTMQDTKSRAGRYAAVAVGLSFIGNLVHFFVKADWGDTADVLAVGTEALFGPTLVLIASHLLLHARREASIETVALWAGFVCGALLSGVHLYGIAAVVGVGPEVNLAGLLFHPLAILLPVGVEGASIGSIRQYARVRQALEDTETAVTQAALAQQEAETKAARDADAEARRRVEVERAAADRIAAEAEAEALVTRERKEAAEAVVAARKVSKGKASAEDTEAAIAAFLAAHSDDRDGKGPALTTVAEALDVAGRTVQRAEAWKNRNARPDRELEVVA